VNSIRSFPIITLIVAISPITRLIVGTTIGETAAIFPLTIAATPFMARILENSLLAVDRQLIEAARSFGASDWQIITRVMVKEAMPLIVSGTTLSAITFLSATTLAGAVGAGGIGAVALNYGYQSFNNTVLYTSVVILFIMVQAIQITGDWLYKKIL
jgi:D-methionine transport system permease protein